MDEARAVEIAEWYINAAIAFFYLIWLPGLLLWYWRNRAGGRSG